MVIETKFNKGDHVFVIKDDKVINIPVNGVRYVYGRIYYDFIIKGNTSLDNDKTFDKEEHLCFESIDALAKYWCENYIKH
ncbi:MAG: hypothetical protein ACOC2W_03845 [bacterium]